MYTNRLIPKLIQFNRSLSPCYCHQRSHQMDFAYSTESTVSKISTLDPKPIKWDLISAVCLERTPLITPLLAPIEEEIIQMLDKLETINSLKSDHEIWEENDKKIAKNRKELEENDPDLASKQTSQDYEDACNEELAKFECASRKTSADSSHDLKSLDRKLDKHLVYVVQKETGDKVKWTLPQSNWECGETLRQTAERALQNHIPDTNVRFLGNAPWGVHTIKYSASQRAKIGTLGLKIFFFKAQLLERKFISSSPHEYNWLGREELASFLEPDFHRSVSQFIVDED